MKLVVLAVCVACLVIVAAGCGGDDESLSAGEWAESFCSATLHELEGGQRV